MPEAQTLLIQDLEKILERAKSGEFTPTNEKDRKPIFTFRDCLADLNAKAIHEKYNQ